MITIILFFLCAVMLFRKTPFYNNWIAKHTFIFLYEAENDFVWDINSLQGTNHQEIPAHSIIALKENEKTTSVDIFLNGKISFSVEEDISGINGRYPLSNEIQTTQEIYNYIEVNRSSNFTIEEAKDLIEYYNSVILDNNKTLREIYLESMIGQTYSKSNGNPYLKNGDIHERKICCILDESHLEYTYGKYQIYVNDLLNIEWIPIEIYQETTVEYVLDIGLFGRASIKFNDKKYKLEVDESHQITEIYLF